MHAFSADLRYALRRLRQAPGFTLTAVLTLALGIGATTAIFTLIYQVMLRSLPVAHPEQIYKLGKDLKCCDDAGLQGGDWNLFSYDLYRFLRDRVPGSVDIAAVQAASTTVSVRREGDASVQPLAARFVSGNYFDLLGVQAYAGRMLHGDDDREGAAPAAVISYTLWRTKFAADPHLVGATLLLSGHPVTVAGIAAENFLGERNTQDAPGLWLPLTQESVFEAARPFMRFPQVNWLDLLVRVPDAQQAPAVELALRGGLQQWLAANRGLFKNATGRELARQTTELAPASGGLNNLRERYEGSLKLLQTLAAFVLLIACANLANLLLVRGISRGQELAVRAALGAPRMRLLRQTVLEAVLLSLAGAAMALAVAYGGTRALLSLAFRGSASVPIDAAPSLPVLAFALATALAAGVLFGIGPAWLGARANPIDALRGANRSSGDRSARPQRVLVTLQAALSLALLATAGLLVTSLHRLEHQDFRFEPQGRLLVFTDLEAAGYQAGQLAGLYRRLDNAFESLAGIESFAYGTYSPQVDDNWGDEVYLPGIAAEPGRGHASYVSVSARYFETLGTRVLDGRGFQEADTATAAQVAVVNQTFARSFFRGRRAVGGHFGPNPQLAADLEVVGVVEDTKYGSPGDPVKPMYFTPITQVIPFTDGERIAAENAKHFAYNFIFRYHGSEQAAEAAVRQALKGVDINIPILHMQPYADQVGDQFRREKLVVRLTSLFGLLALGLAALGLYGVTAYGVARRTSEIGLRMALGASRGGVVALILRGALRQAVVGLALGLPLAYLAARLLTHTLYQTSPFQPLILLGAAACLLLASLVAALVPARRAASIDPVIALRSE